MSQAIKRAYSSTTTDLDSSALDQSIPSDRKSNPEGKNKKKKKKSTNKQRKMDDFYGQTDLKSEHEPSTVEQKIDLINEKLANMLTKDDSCFLKKIISTTLEEMKENILKTVIKRIEVLESDLHDKCVETDSMKKEMKKRDEKIDSLKNENVQLKAKLEIEKQAREKDSNDSEQYSRRNNIRITGIPRDSEKQPSASVIDLVVKTLNEKSNLNIKSTDIDIAHRLGHWKKERQRPVIVRFVRRQTKIEVMKRSKDLRQRKIYVNEDLTWLNQQVLSSLRLKNPEQVAKCWSFEGKLFAKYKDSTQNTEIKYKDYAVWLNKPWPKKAHV